MAGGLKCHSRPPVGDNFYSLQCLDGIEKSRNPLKFLSENVGTGTGEILVDKAEKFYSPTEGQKSHCLLSTTDPEQTKFHGSCRNKLISTNLLRTFYAQ